MNDVWLALGGLAASGFLSSTLLFGNSEIALSAFLIHWPQWLWPALLIATVSNTAGSMTSFYLGKVVPKTKINLRAEQWITRFGPAALILSWVPIIGDALPLVAGWLRLSVIPCLFWIALGKSLRYAVLAFVVMHFFD